MSRDAGDHRLLAEIRRAILRLSGKHVREAIERALHDLAGRLDTFPHQKLKGVDAYKLRVENYRVIYEFDRNEGRVHALAADGRHADAIPAVRDAGDDTGEQAAVVRNDG